MIAHPYARTIKAGLLLLTHSKDRSCQAFADLSATISGYGQLKTLRAIIPLVTGDDIDEKIEEARYVRDVAEGDGLHFIQAVLYGDREALSDAIPQRWQYPTHEDWQTGCMLLAGCVLPLLWRLTDPDAYRAALTLVREANL